MKIGITCYPSVGGSGIVATELGKLLAGRGHEIHFITSSVPFRLMEVHSNIYFHQVDVNHYPVFQHPPYDLALANKMAEVIDTEQLDILHVHYAMPHAICAILAKQMAKRKVKIVTTLHGTDITVLGIDSSLTKIIQYGIESSDVVTAVSNSLAKQTIDALQIERPIEVVYNFIDQTEYYHKPNEELKRLYNIKPNEKVLIHISNFRKVKRVEDVINTFAKVLSHLPAKLLLVGDGPEYSAMYQLADKLNITDHILFLGKQNDIVSLLSLADLKLLMSEKESFGLVLIEAMACGIPCIGTEVGGVPEVIADKENGFIVPLGDTTRAAQCALLLLNDKDMWRKFSAHAMAHVNDHFSATKIIKQYENLYDQNLKVKRYV